MVKTAVQWNWNRAKIQWKFLHPRERTEVKLDVLLGLVFLAFLASDIFTDSVFIPKPILVGLDSLISIYFFRSAWLVFTDHISPKILSHEDLTEGTE